jgi:hypothetical protein
MASTTLVDEVRRILEELRVERGDFSLAMLFSSFEGGDAGWNLIVSAPWTDGMKTADATRLVAETLQKELSEENKRLISRVTVLRTDDGFVQALNRSFELSSPGSLVRIENSSFFGITVPRGFLYYSHSPVAA